MIDVPQQLGLRVFLRDTATFDTFVADTEAARLALTQATTASQSRADNLVFWGGKSCGLSHLLQALAREVAEGRRIAQYLPLAEFVSLSASQVLSNLDDVDVLCLDDLDVIAGNKEWELGLFHLYNELKSAGGQLVCAMHSSPQELDVELPDLHSRLRNAATFHVPPLSDEGKIEALIRRADCSGMALSPEVAKYLMSRVSRETGDLFVTLEKLEHVSLREQRKLTVPFVKQVLGIS